MRRHQIIGQFVLEERPPHVSRRCGQLFRHNVGREAFAALKGVIEASGAPEDPQAERLRRVAALFGLGPELVTSRKAS